MVKPGESGPSFVQKPYIDQSPDGRVLTFACKIAGNPKPSITWYRGNDEIRDGGRYFMDVLSEGNAYVVSLEIDSVTPSDGGNYKIVAKNQHGQSSGNIALNFGQEPDAGNDQVKGSAPRFTMKPVMKQADDGKKLTIQCELEADPRPQITWSCNGKELFDGGKFKIITDADEEFYFLSLTIDDLSDADGGDYVVFAKNALGESTSTIKLNFGTDPSKPQKKGKAPQFASKPLMRQSKDGHELVFETTLTADPQPQITWYCDTTVIKEGGRYHIITKKESADQYYVSLEIADVTPEDQAVYKVVAVNDLGENSSTINLNFNIKKEAITFPERPSIRQEDGGKILIMEQKMIAEPKPSIVWKHNGSLVTDGGRFKLSMITQGKVYILKLVVSDFTPPDGGIYTIEAKNERGEANSTITVNVDVQQAELQQQQMKKAGEKVTKEGAISFPERPSIRQEDGGKTLIMEQKMIAEPKPSIVWKHNGSVVIDGGRFTLSVITQGKVYILKLVVSDFTPPDGGIYTIEAKNERGEANSTITVNVDVQQAELQQQQMKKAGEKEQAPPIEIDFGDMADMTITKDSMKIDLSSTEVKMAEQSISVSSTAVEETEKVVKPTFLEGMKNFTVKDGGEVLFRVRISGTPTVTWLRAGKPIKASIDFIMKQVKDVYTLTIVEVFPEDSGTYSCRAVNSAGEMTSKAQLEVVEPPPKPKKKKPIEEEPMLAKKDTPAQESAPPPPEEPKKRKPIEEEPMLAKKDTPAQESAPPPEEPKKMKPVEEEPMLAKKNAPAQEAAPPGAAKPKGEENGEKEPEPKLKREPPKAKPKLERRDSLAVRMGLTGAGFLTKEDEENQVIGFSSRRTKMPPPIKQKDTVPGAPYFIETPQKAIAKEGDNVKFEAVVEGDPEPKVNWYRGARLLSDGGRFMIFYNEIASVHTMQIKKILPKDTGKYCCKVENDKGNDSSAFSLLVEALAKDDVDWRSMLKHKEYGRRESKDEDPDWGSLKKRGSKGSIDEGAGQFKLKKVERKQKSYAEVTAPLKNTKVNASLGRVRLPCGVRYLNCEPKWYKDGKLLENGEKYKLMKRKEDVELIILDIKPEDSGEYSVEFGDPAIAGSNAELIVEPAKKRTRFTKKLRSCQVKEGEEAKFECIVTNPNLPFHWEKNGVPVKRDKRHQVIDVGKTRILMIKNVTPADEGEIKCFCGDEPDSAEMFVEAKPKPQFVKQLQSQQVMEKDRAVLQVDVNMDDIELVWLKDGAPIKADNRVKIRHAGLIHTLIFEDVKMDDEADYEVKVKGVEDTNCSCSLLVDEYKPPPDFNKKLTDVIGCEDEEAVFVAEVNDKDVEVQWLKDGKPIEKDPRIKHIKQGVLRKLVIKPVTPEDQGEYTCIAGDKKSVAALKVEARPKLVLPDGLRKISVRKGQPIRLEVPVSGKPPPEVRWLKNGKPLKPTKDLKMERTPDKAILYIPACERDDSGAYQLEVSNAHGTDTADMDIGVVDVPGSPKTVKVCDTTTSSISVKWEAPDLDGGCEILGYNVEKCDANKDEWTTVAEKVPGNEFKVPKLIENKQYKIRVSAVNEIGVSEPKEIDKPATAKDPFDPADPPGKPEVLETHKGFVKLKWPEPASDGGSPIKGYYIEKKETKGKKWTKALKSPVQGTEAGIPDLVDGEEYQFRIVAENKAGVSEASPLSEAVLAREPIDPTDPPGVIKVDDITKESAKLAWEKPVSDGGSPVKGYIVEKREVGKENWEKCNKAPVKEENFKVEGLEEDKEYEFRVMAENEAGVSEPSEASEPIIAKDPKVAPEIDLSKLPKEITVKAGQMFRVNAPFSGSPAPEAKWMKDGKEVTPDTTVKVNSTPTESTLINRAAERVDTGVYQLVVSNDSGTQTADVKVNVLDKPSTPEGPLDVSDVYAESCKLHWNPPKDDGGCEILNYIIEKRDEKRATWTPVSDDVPADATSFDVKKLVPGNKYDFRVRAENNEGVGDPLETTKPTLAKNPYDEPDSPGVPIIEDYDKDFIDLVWEAPKKDGGAPIEGYKVEKRDKANNRWVPAFEEPIKGTKCKVTDLMPGHDYDFRVSAINKAGKGKPSEVSNPQKVKAKFEKPSFDPSAMKDIKVKAGQNFKISVPIDGAPPPTVTWKKNGEEIKPSDRVKENATETNADLLTNAAERDDSGEYELILTNSQGSVSTKCKVNVLDKPTAPEGPLEASNVTAHTLSLTWNPPKDNGGTPIAAYVVEKRDTSEAEWSTVSSFVPVTKCDVGKLKEGKEYEFRVRAENEHGGLSEPLMTTKPIIAKNPYDPSGAPGKPDITAYDRHQMDLQWTPPKNDGGAPITGYVVEKKDTKANRWVKCSKSQVIGTKFTVTGLIEGKEYQFRVFAENKAGLGEPSEESNAQIAKPQFEKPRVELDPFMQTIKVLAGEELKIDVPIIGSPPPTVTWFKDNKPISPSDRTSTDGTDEKALLTTMVAERADTGTYKIQLENSQGTDTADIKVIVLDKPTAPKGPLTPTDVNRDSVTLTWKEPEDDGGGIISAYVVEKKKVNEDTWTKVANSVPSTKYTVKMLDENEDYVFRVRAANQYGVSEPLDSAKPVTVKLPFDAPDAPGTPKITDYDKHTISLEWKKPDYDGGDPITGYIIECKDVDNSRWVKANISPCRDTKFTVPNLKEGTEYEFRVMAVNEAGPGKPSRVSDKQMARNPVFAADAPGRPRFDKITKDSAKLSWDKPVNDGGAPITGYVIEKKEPGKDWQEAVSVPAKEDTATVPKLIEGTEYEFRVRAVNETGPGKPSSALKTVAEDKPEKPLLDIGNLRDFKVKAGETFDITIPFTGVPVPTVTWTLRGKDVQETSKVTMKTTETTIVIKVEDAHRENGGVYQVTLKNASGSDSAKVKVTVLDAPGTPEGPLLASDVTANSLTIHWKPPLDGADETDNYIVEKCEAGTGKWQRITSFCSGPSCKVRNLNEGTEYQFRVMAENQYGASKPLTGESVVAKNPFNCPGSPGQPKATDTTKTSISLQWTAPSSDGGNPIIGYLVEKMDLNNNKWVMVTKSPVRSPRFTVPKLIEGHEYEFRVSAVNEAGPGKPSSTSEAITAAPPATKPSISPEFKHKIITVRAGDPFRLEVPFDGTPVPQAIWSLEDKGDVEIKPTDRLLSETDEASVILKCKCAERDDTGRYKLTLKNPKGSDTASMKVNVVDHPGPPDGPLNVSGITADSVKLAWNPPKDDGGSSVTNYIIEKRETGTSTWMKVSTFAKSTYYEVPNLEEGVEYSFRVRAENEYGISDPLDTSRPVTAKNPYDVPDAPGKPDIKGIDRSFVSLKWTEPESDGGSPILGFFVEKKERESSTWLPAVEYVVKANTVSLVNLDEDTEYEFRIKAKNAAGYGRPSKNSDSVTPRPQYTTPGAPGTPIIDDVDKHHIDLSWSPPRNDGGSKVAGYNVEYREPNSDIWTKANIFTTKEPRFTVGDLTEGQQYIFRVIAINVAGPGEPSGETDPVEAKDKIVGEPAGFVKRLSRTTNGVSGEPLKLEVEIKGLPKPTVRWFRDGQEVFSSFQYSLKESGDVFTLSFKELALKDAGDYACEVHNKLGTEKCVTRFIVVSPPKIDGPLKDVATQVGSNFKIKVPFKAVGNIDASLSKDGKKCDENDRLKIMVFDNYVTLAVKDARPNDEGVYKLTISNDIGSDTAPINVKVLQAPDSPRTLDVGDVTKSTITITWKPPEYDGGTPIRSYVVERKKKKVPTATLR